MNSARSLVYSLAVMVGASAKGQCGMTVALVHSTQTFGCPAVQGIATVNTTGGTAPFQIALSMHLWPDPLNTWTNGPTLAGDADGDEVVYYPAHMVETIRVTVTDALGCVATAQTQVSPVQYGGSLAQMPVTVLQNGCTGMARLRFRHTIGTNHPCCSAAAHTLTVTNTTTNFATSFLVGTGCTVQADNYLTTVQEFPPGNYQVEFNNMTTCGSTECWYAATCTIANVSGLCGANLRVRACLAGGLNTGTLMSDALRGAGLVPITEPYSALGYAYSGTAAGGTTTTGLLAATGNDAIVDWVIIELRHAATPSQVLFSGPFLIQRDGDVVTRDGRDWLDTPLSPGSYHVALRHRNHLGIMTASPIALTTTAADNVIDFRLSAQATYGTSARTLLNTVWCLLPGDVTGDGTLKYTGANNDRDPILTAIGGTTPNNTLNNVYDRRDVNLDGVVKYTGANNDRDPILTNVGSTTPNNTRTQQLP